MWRGEGEDGGRGSTTGESRRCWCPRTCWWRGSTRGWASPRRPQCWRRRSRTSFWQQSLVRVFSSNKLNWTGCLLLRTVVLYHSSWKTPPISIPTNAKMWQYQYHSLRQISAGEERGVGGQEPSSCWAVPTKIGGGIFVLVWYGLVWVNSEQQRFVGRYWFGSMGLVWVPLQHGCHWMWRRLRRLTVHILVNNLEGFLWFALVFETYVLMEHNCCSIVLHFGTKLWLIMMSANKRSNFLAVLTFSSHHYNCSALCWPKAFLPCLDVRKRSIKVFFTLWNWCRFLWFNNQVNFGKALALLCISIVAMPLSSVLQHVFTIVALHKVLQNNS